MRGNRKNIWKPTWKPTLGENIIKMVSFLDEDGKIQFFSTYKAHYLDAVRMIVCPKTWNERCPICDYLEYTGLNTDHDLYRRLKMKQKTMYNIVDLTSNPDNNEVGIHDVSTWLFHRELMDLLSQPGTTQPELRSATPTAEDALNYLIALDKFKNKSTPNVLSIYNNYLKFECRKPERFWRRACLHEYNNFGLFDFLPDRTIMEFGSGWNLQKLIDEQRITFEEIHEKLMYFLKEWNNTKEKR